MRLTKVAAILTGCSVLCSVQAADSSATAAKAKRGLPLEKDFITQAVLADQLATLGESRKDPLAFLMAARIQKKLRIRNAEGAQEGDDSRFLYFIARAKELSVGSDDYKALIEEVGAPAPVSRGTLSGNVLQQRGMLSAGKTQTFSLSFKGGEDAAAALMLDLAKAAEGQRAEIDLDLYVSDANGRRVCAVEGPGVPELCTWTPETTGKFIIELKNPGRIDAPYVLNFR